MIHYRTGVPPHKVEAEVLQKQLTRLENLDRSFTSGKVTKTQELVWGFINQIHRGHPLTKKQLSVLGELEYRADINGPGWEMKKDDQD
jgi:hypothetical protein